MKKDRTPEVHYYEWSVPRWVLSSTHDTLDATGRGIYRELLDICYTQGGFPFDVPLLCRKCACTEQQFMSVWDQIERHFPQDSHRPGTRINRAASTYRKSYFGYVHKQRRNRKGYAANTGITTPEESTGSETVVRKKITTVKKNLNGGFTLHDTTLHDTTLHEFDYERSFADLWNAYPAKGRTKIEDSKRQYVEHVSPDPERIHSQIMAAVAGKWAESDSWAKGYVCGLSEFLRNSRWLEDPEPFKSPQPKAPEPQYEDFTGSARRAQKPQ